MMINRIAKERIIEKINRGKVVVLLGARRTGKTILLNQIKSLFSEKIIFWNGEDMAVHEILKRRTVENYRSLLVGAELLLIDEAQKIPQIGKILKLIVDSLYKL